MLDEKQFQSKLDLREARWRDAGGPTRKLTAAIAPPGQPLHGVKQIVLVVVACFAAFAVALSLAFSMGNDARPLMLMVLAVVIATVYGGLQAGILATLLGTALSTFLLLDERWVVFGTTQAVNLAVFAVAALVVSSVIDAMRTAQDVAGERQRLLREMADITDERQSALTKLERVLSLAPVGIAICEDSECRYLRVNDELARILGVPAGNIGSRSAPVSAQPSGFKLCREGVEVPPEQLPLQVAIRTGRPVADHGIEVVRDDGGSRRVLIDAAPLLDAENNIRGGVAAIVDVTARREMEEMLARSEERFRIAIGALPMFVFNQDRDLRYTWVSRLGPGFSNEEILGQTDEALFAPADAGRLTAIKRRALDTGERTREEITVDYGGEARTFDVTVEPYRDGTGDITGIIGAAFDVTERKRIEEALREANKAKDDFVGHVSHEMKTPITLIKGNAEVLDRRAFLLTDQDRRDALADIAEAADRLEQVIDNLLVLARVTEGHVIEREPMLIEDVVRLSVEDHRRLFPHRQIEILVDGDPAYAFLSASATGQALTNLLSNAEKYSPKEVPIEIRISGDEARTTIAVRDHGDGFSEDEAERLFARFYRSPRTARSASGLGIGLGVCRQLVEAQGGQIAARPATGGGAEFVVSFPVADKGEDEAE